MKNYLRTYICLLSCFSPALSFSGGWSMRGSEPRTSGGCVKRGSCPRYWTFPSRAYASWRSSGRASVWSSSAGAPGRDDGRWSSRKTWRRSRPDWKPWFETSRNCAGRSTREMFRAPPIRLGWPRRSRSISLWGETAARIETSRSEPIATLALGKTVRGTSLCASRLHRLDRGRR